MAFSFTKLTDAANQLLAILFTLCSGVDARTDDGAQKKQTVVDAIQALYGEFNLPSWLKGVLDNDLVLGTIIDWISGLLDKTLADEKLLPYFDAGRKVAFLVDLVVKSVEGKLGDGTGAEKRTAAIALLKTMINGLDIADWAKLIFTRDAVLGVLIDVVVSTLNKLGIFSKNA